MKSVIFQSHSRFVKYRRFGMVPEAFAFHESVMRLKNKLFPTTFQTIYMVYRIIFQKAVVYSCDLNTSVSAQVPK